MNPRLLFAALSLLPPTVLIVACATDNGSDVHGPTFGQLPPREGGVDGEILEDGAVVTDAPSGDTGEDVFSPTCNEGTAVVLAGNDTSLSGAVQSKGGAWNGSAIAGGAAKSKPGIVAFGTGFLGATHGPADVLQSLTFASAWAPPTTIGTAGVKGAPALATVGTKAHVVYSTGTGGNTDFTHGIHDGNAWNVATATVGTPPNASFGTVSGGLAGVGNDLFFAENGSNNGLYARIFDTAWQPSTAINGAGTVGNDPATPELVAMAGKYDLVLVYVEKTTRYIAFATHDATTKAWVDGDVTNTLATTNEKIAASRSGEFTMLVTFRGQDGNGYYTQGSLAANTYTWSAPAPIGGGPAKIPVDSTPAVARGVCGDDAIVVYASGGIVRALHLRGTQWSQPELVTGTSGSRVAVAAR